MPVLRHRLVINYAAQAEGETSDTIVDALLQTISRPQGADARRWPRRPSIPILTSSRRSPDLTLRSRRLVEGAISGLHRSPFHGFNVEFAEYREYTPGDDLRRLDWRVLGRTDRFYIKQYEEESNVRVTLVVDASASMSYGSGPLTKFDYARDRWSSRWRCCWSSSKTRSAWSCSTASTREILPPAATQAQLARIIGLLGSGQARPRDRAGRRAAIARRASSSSAGWSIIVSDLLTDLDTFYDGLRRLQYRGHEVLVLHVLDRDELELPFNDLVLFRDIEGSEELFAEPWAFRKAYREAMQQFVGEVQRGCGDRGIDYLLLRTDQPLADVLSHYLHARERLKHITRRGHR